MVTPLEKRFAENKRYEDLGEGFYWMNWGEKSIVESIGEYRTDWELVLLSYSRGRLCVKSLIYGWREELNFILKNWWQVQFIKLKPPDKTGYYAKSYELISSFRVK